jgi:hypothetical protein
MAENIFVPDTLLGPLKLYGTSKPESFAGYQTGWFYPLYTTRKEAIQADIDRTGKGVYQTITFYGRTGEFYIPDSFKNLAQLKDPLIYTLYEGNGAENPFKRIQNRLSILVEDQLPDFIQSDYGMFVTFIKAYYEFLEQNNQAQEILQDISKYADIDETTENLVTRFIQNYANDLTVSSSANNRLLIKKIREIYSKKGTEPAYRILFNVLYKESIDFFYPYDIVLKTSDGKLVTPRALRVKQITGRQNIFDFENTEIVGVTSKAKAIVNKVIKIDLNGFDVYELMLDTTSISGEFLADEQITATKTILLTGEKFTTTKLTARLYSVVSRIDIVDGGLGYRKDNQITITDESGILARAKINSVNRFGSITNIEIIEPGLNYSANTIINPGLPTESLTGTYIVKKGQVTLTFPIQHGLVRGKNINAYYTGNVFSPIDNTSHNAIITSIPNVRSIRYKYPGF